MALGLLRGAGVWFAGAAVLGLLAGGITYTAVQRSASGVPVAVWVAPVRPGQVVAPEMVAVDRRPELGLPPDAVRNPAEAAGAVALVGGLPGDVVRSGALAATDGSDRRLAVLLAADPGRVAYALPGDVASGAGSLIPPGGAVDVYGVLDLPVAGGTSPTAVLIVPGAPVLLTRPPSDSGGPGVLVVSLTREEAARVALAQARGKVLVAQVAPGAPRGAAAWVSLDRLKGGGGDAAQAGQSGYGGGR